MIDTVVILVKGGTPTTAVTPIEILSSAGFLYEELRGSDGKRQFDVRTASLKGKKVQTLAPLSLEADHAIEEITSTDLVVVAAGGGDLEDILEDNAGLISPLEEFYNNGTAIAGICSGVTLLAEAGLLDGNPATTHWALVDDCRQRYPEVDWQPERYVTESNNIFCSGGVYSGVDLCLYLIEKYCGHSVAMQTARALVLRTPRIWQTGYSAETPNINHEDEQIRKAQEWLFKNFKKQVTVADIASTVGMSPRSFARRFKVATGDTPNNYLQRMRINAARHLLENDLKTVREVSLEVGYEDQSYFSRLFKRYTEMSPQSYRERFSSNNIAGGYQTPHK